MEKKSEATLSFREIVQAARESLVKKGEKPIGEPIFIYGFDYADSVFNERPSTVLKEMRWSVEPK